MVEKQKYDVKIHFKSRFHEWTTIKKTVFAKGLYEALESTLEEERKPGRWDIHGAAKPANQFRSDW